MKRRIDATVSVNGTLMEYVAFGKGERPLVVLPGLSDGLTTVAGKSFMLSWYYRRFAKHFRVYVFSRRRDLPERYTTRQMAADQGIAMRSLGLQRAFVIGVSQGGMVAQFLAIDQPELVSKLILAVTTPNAGDVTESVVSSWMNMACAGDYRSLVIDTMEKTYTEAYCRRMRPLYPIISRVGRPKSFDRFLTQARACIDHSATRELDRIGAPTLCIGGGDDHVVGLGRTEALAAGIVGAEIEVYPGLGHGAFEETKAFNERMLEFLLRE
jgi:pimeloyl-ACP methyl ester carboxylesterase